MTEKQIIRTTPSLLNNWSLCIAKGAYTDIFQIALDDPKIAPGSSSAMDIGTLIHAMLEVYYQLQQWTDFPRELRRIEAIAYGRKKAVGLSLDSADTETAIDTFNQYVAYYADELLTPIEVEQPFSKVFLETDTFIILLEGKKDLVADWQGDRWIFDHKSSSRKGFLSPLSNQFIAYAWAEERYTVVINSIGTQKTVAPSEKFRRELINYTPAQIAEWYLETCERLTVWVDAIAKNRFPRTLTSCIGKYGNICQFHRICKAEPGERQRIMNIYYKHKAPHDPFGDTDE